MLHKKLLKQLDEKFPEILELYDKVMKERLASKEIYYLGNNKSVITKSRGSYQRQLMNLRKILFKIRFQHFYNKTENLFQ
jgi:hypothetical protein